MLSAAKTQVESSAAHLSEEQRATLQAQMEQAQAQLAMIGNMSFEIKLNKGTVCAMGACQSFEIDTVSRFGATWILGMIVLAGLAWIAFNRLQGEFSPPFQGGIAAFAMGLLLFTWFSASGMPEIPAAMGGVERGLGPWFTAGGAFTGLLAIVLLGRGGDATSSMTLPTYTPMATSRAPGSAAPGPYARGPLVTGQQRAVGTTNPPGGAMTAAITNPPRTAPLIDLALPAADAETARFALRAEASIARVSPKGIQAKVSPGDAIVAIAWDELQEMRVWALPEEVQDGRVFAEFVGAIGATIRLTIATSMQYRDLQAPDGASFDATLAFIARVILSQKPGFTLDDQTLYFLRGEAAPQRFASLTALREHDKTLT